MGSARSSHSLSSVFLQCEELQGFIRPLTDLLNGLKMGRFERGTVWLVAFIWASFIALFLSPSPPPTFFPLFSLLKCFKYVFLLSLCLGPGLFLYVFCDLISLGEPILTPFYPSFTWLNSSISIFDLFLSLSLTPGLSSFQQSVAMDRIQRIVGVLQKPQMG